MLKLVSRSAAETKVFARRTIHKLTRAGHRPLVIALSGELGSGKTTFIQGLAAALGIRAKLQSPTFVLMKRYRLPRAGQGRPYRHLVHADAYRLNSSVDARRAGLSAAFGDADDIVVIEWAERIRKLVPKRAVWIRFTHGRRFSERVIELVKRVQ